MSKQEEKAQEQNVQKEDKPTCGIIMPISSIDGCSAKHWEEVKDILTEAIDVAGFSANLVSEANNSSVIQNRIVKNLHDNEIVICDVSCKNPNVMFELGLRLAFDKPTIIIMDDNTDYIFDVNIIEHLKYPRDLSYYKILEFKEQLSAKITGTIKESQNPNYTTFLKHFGDFTAVKIDDKKIPMNSELIPYFEDISKRLAMVIQNQQNVNLSFPSNEREEIINRIVRKGIKSFVQEFEVSIDEISNNDNGAKTLLRKYLEEKEELRLLCRSRSRLDNAINYNLAVLLK